jgi:hypothetical protein
MYLSYYTSDKIIVPALMFACFGLVNFILATKHAQI